MSEGELASWAIIVLCFGGIALIARYNYLRTRDAGGGWTYVYWQPWRKWVVFGTIGFLAAFTVLTRVASWIDPAPLAAPELPSGFPAQPLQ